MKIRLHAFEPASRANGPGLRAAVWLAWDIAAAGGIEGVSVSSGEPFQQTEALADLLHRLRAPPQGAEILANLDVLIAGPYLQSQHLGRGLLGSANQRLHLLTSRYKLTDFARLPSRLVPPLGNCVTFACLARGAFKTGSGHTAPPR